MVTGTPTAADDLAVPLAATTFVVFDLETTGVSSAVDAVTEVGAVKVRGGEVLGTFATLVDPGPGLPPESTPDGVTAAMVRSAPSIEAVLPAFLEWVGRDVVLVGHNVRFDVSFVRAACDALGYGRPEHRVVDTCTLARRLLRDDVPNHRLGTLAALLDLPHRPTHRALADAWATVDLLHALLERVGSLGVTHLDDLLELPKVAGHPQGDKLRWVAALPRLPGTYELRDPRGRPLYVGAAAELRSGVRRHFADGGPRSVPRLLREAASLDHEVCAHELEASIRQIRRVHEVAPRDDLQGKRWRRYRWVRLTDEPWPRLSVVARPRPGDIGPLPSARAAAGVVAAVLDAVPLRRCTGRVPDDPATDATAYAATAELVRGAFTGDPAPLLERIAARHHRHAAEGRPAEAAELSDRLADLSRAIALPHRLAALQRTGRLVVQVEGEGGAILDGGRLVHAWPGTAHPPAAATPPPAPEPGPVLPPPAAEIEELLVVSRWLRERADRLTVLAGRLPTADELDLPEVEPPPATATPTAAGQPAAGRPA